MTQRSAEIRAQRQAILADLSEGNSLTPQDALQKFRCFRLAARIYDLRNQGHHIVTIWETDGRKRWARYSLPKNKKTAQPAYDA